MAGKSGAGGVGGAFQSLLGIAADMFDMQAQTNAYIENSKELERSARLEDANAVDSLARGAIAAGQARMRGTLLGAKQRVAYAASGVDASTGTAAGVVASTGIYSELDARTLSNNALRESLGHKEVGRKYRLQRQQLEREQRARETKYALGFTGEAINLGTSLLGGG